MSRFASAAEDVGELPEYKGHFSPESLHKMCAGAWVFSIAKNLQLLTLCRALRLPGRRGGSPAPPQLGCSALTAPVCAAEMLEAAGGTAEDSDYVAETLINASLAGVDSHGIIRMERYVGGINEGSVRPAETPEVTVNKGSMALIDGKNQFGQVVARQAMNMCIEKVKEHGLALVSCVNTGHVGRVGEYALMAAREGFVAYCCVNGGAIVAPFGSKGRVWGTNPICCAVPVENGEPLLVDLATSVQAEGKVMSALHKGAELPEDTIISKYSRFFPSRLSKSLTRICCLQTSTASLPRCRGNCTTTAR
jgi:hypothetical protein